MKQTELDKAMLEKLYGHSSADIIDILSEYISLHTHIRSSFASCSKNTNREKLRDLLHYHAPAFTYSGFPSLTDYCFRLEQLCEKKGDMSLIEKNLAELIQQLDISKKLAAQEVAFLTIKPYSDNWGIV